MNPPDAATFSPPAPLGEASRAARSPVVLLLAAVLFLNYVDRGALPTAAHLIQADLNLTKQELGWLMSAFFWSYATIQAPVGWLAEKYGAHRVLAAGLAIWAVSTLLAGFVVSFATFLALRLLLGVGESVGFPCTSKILSSAVPAESLGRANGIIAFAYLMGPAVGTYAGGLLIDHIGWRATFMVFGAVSLLWLAPWSRAGVRQTVRREVPASVASSWAILRQPSLWGTALGHFSSNYTFYFILSWLPTYLIEERGFSTVEMARLASSAYLLTAVFAIAGGWVIDRYIARGGSANLCYKLVLGGAHVGFIVCMLCMAVGSRPVALTCIFVYEALCGFQSPAVYAVSQILAGPAATGRWVSIQNTIGNLAGIVAPALTGFVVQRTGHFTLAFICAAAVGVLGFVGWVLMIPRVRELDWPAQIAGRSSIASTRSG